MDAALRRRVADRAAHRCEYCHISEEQLRGVSFNVEHIIARQHRGSDDAANLAFACRHCNLHKGPNLAGYDPDRAHIVPLFNPRLDHWADHFIFAGPIIRGLSSVGRATVWVLQMNEEDRVDLRATILDTGGTFD